MMMMVMRIVMILLKVVDGRAVGDFIGVDGQLDFIFVPPDDVVVVYFDAEGVDGVVGIVDRWGSDGSVETGVFDLIIGSDAIQLRQINFIPICTDQTVSETETEIDDVQTGKDKNADGQSTHLHTFFRCPFCLKKINNKNNYKKQ
jgi:hypothetical protein